jgi:SAM-dependent methyltransferase
MDFFELVEISTRHLELTTPAAQEKLWSIGHYLGLSAETRVIDFGCGYGRTLALWAKDFGISGIGVDLHAFLCQRARERMSQAGLAEKIEIVCANALEYNFEPGGFDVVVCLGATFIWGGYHQALRRLKSALRESGKIVVGEPYFTQEKSPVELVKFEGDLHTEYQLLQISREAGLEVEFVVRASRDDWDRYVSASWYGLLRWISENPTHPERQYVIDYLHKRQDMYTRYQSEYEGWAIFVLKRVEY